ncbi:hypothetical protein EVAR_43834_1 [Eumeta japonica]|uniref:Uncharacterized protein n=1 Tax=Eumeta variegata TaxID=151549 RepID=A0A4C1WXH8_EUMVA|nr:hypothetical protein EVAR_43834_1 [Eumeta japonica]
MDGKPWKNNGDKQKPTTKAKGSPKTNKKYTTPEECITSPDRLPQTPRLVVDMQRVDRLRSTASSDTCRNPSFGRTDTSMRRRSPNKLSERGDTQKILANFDAKRNYITREAYRKSRRRKKLGAPPSSGGKVTLRSESDETHALELEDFILTTSTKVKITDDGPDGFNSFYYEAWIDPTLTAVPMRAGDEEARRMIMDKLRGMMKRRVPNVRECIDCRRMDRMKVYR